MGNSISDGICILTAQDLEARTNAAFQRGVERGKFEARLMQNNEKVALNCANWKNGRCGECGAQWQGHEVDATFKCPHFKEKP